MIYFLYKTTNNINGKIYVGVHATSDEEDGYFGSGKVIKRAVEKYGIENFSVEILERFATAGEMYLREKEVVTDEFLARPDVYNLRRGGTGGFDFINKEGLNDRTGAVLLPEQKMNIGAGVKRSMTPERADSISQRQAGNKHAVGNRGNTAPRAPEHKEKIRLAIKRRWAEKQMRVE